MNEEMKSVEVTDCVVSALNGTYFYAESPAPGGGNYVRVFDKDRNEVEYPSFVLLRALFRAIKSSKNS